MSRNKSEIYIYIYISFTRNVTKVVNNTARRRTSFRPSTDLKISSRCMYLISRGGNSQVRKSNVKGRNAKS